MNQACQQGYTTCGIQRRFWNLDSSEATPIPERVMCCLLHTRLVLHRFHTLFSYAAEISGEQLRHCHSVLPLPFAASSVKSTSGRYKTTELKCHFPLSPDSRITTHPCFAKQQWLLPGSMCHFSLTRTYLCLNLCFILPCTTVSLGGTCLWRTEEIFYDVSPGWVQFAEMT